MSTVCIAALKQKNSPDGSVKPKMHGPEEVAFTNSIFEKLKKF